MKGRIFKPPLKRGRLSRTEVQSTSSQSPPVLQLGTTTTDAIERTNLGPTPLKVEHASSASGKPFQYSSSISHLSTLRSASVPQEGTQKLPQTLSATDAIPLPVSQGQGFDVARGVVIKREDACAAVVPRSGGSFPLFDLPGDFLYAILARLGAQDLTCCASTCRFLRTVCDDDVFWRRLFRCRWGTAATEEAEELRRQSQEEGGKVPGMKTMYMRADAEDWTETLMDLPEDVRAPFACMMAARRNQEPDAPVRPGELVPASSCLVSRGVVGGAQQPPSPPPPPPPPPLGEEGRTDVVASSGAYASNGRSTDEPPHAALGPRADLLETAVPGGRGDNLLTLRALQFEPGDPETLLDKVNAWTAALKLGTPPFSNLPSLAFHIGSGFNRALRPPVPDPPVTPVSQVQRSEVDIDEDEDTAWGQAFPAQQTQHTRGDATLLDESSSDSHQSSLIRQSSSKTGTFASETASETTFCLPLPQGVPESEDGETEVYGTGAISSSPFGENSPGAARSPEPRPKRPRYGSCSFGFGPSFGSGLATAGLGAASLVSLTSSHPLNVSEVPEIGISGTEGSLRSRSYGRSCSDALDPTGADVADVGITRKELGNFQLGMPPPPPPPPPLGLDAGLSVSPGRRKAEGVKNVTAFAFAATSTTSELTRPEVSGEVSEAPTSDTMEGHDTAMPCAFSPLAVQPYNFTFTQLGQDLYGCDQTGWLHVCGSTCSHLTPPEKPLQNLNSVQPLHGITSTPGRESSDRPITNSAPAEALKHVACGGNSWEGLLLLYCQFTGRPVARRGGRFAALSPSSTVGALAGELGTSGARLSLPQPAVASAGPQSRNARVGFMNPGSRHVNHTLDPAPPSHWMPTMSPHGPSPVRYGGISSSPPPPGHAIAPAWAGAAASDALRPGRHWAVYRSERQLYTSYYERLRSQHQYRRMGGEEAEGSWVCPPQGRHGGSEEPLEEGMEGNECDFICNPSRAFLAGYECQNDLELGRLIRERFSR